MFKIRSYLTDKLTSASTALHGSLMQRIARYTSLLFAILVSAGISHVGFAHVAHDIRVSELEAARAMAIKAEKTRQTVCLTNIVHHEARGEKSETRKLLGKVVHATASDPTFSKAKTVCDLGKIGGMFSQIKYVTEVRTDVPLWNTVFAEMTQVMDGDKSLPPGWGCVRQFRLSDDTLEKMNGKSLHQLGFTVNATGLKYFAAKLVPVGTHGTITFYQDRSGCKKPTQTAQK